MDIFKILLDEIRKIVRSEVQEALKETPVLEDKWLDKKQLAEYWGVSTKWIDKKIDEIPKSSTIPWRFKRTEVDMWRKGEKLADTGYESKVSIGAYKKNNFKVG